MSYLKCTIYALIGLGFAKVGWANTVIKVDNHRPDENFIPTFIKQPQSQSTPTSHPAENQARKRLTLTKAELAQQPELLIRALIPALRNNDMPAVETLRPLYAQQAQQDALLLKWADAILAHKNDQLDQAITLYRELLAEQPKLQPARLQLAIVLFKNRHNEAAKEQFTKLRSESLPTVLDKLVQDYLDHINKQDDVNFYATVNYLRESNVNNAPKAQKVEGFSPSSQAERAEGLGYYFSANKNWSLTQGWFAISNAELNGKYYWDNRKYNELNLKGILGVGYRNAQTEIKFMPYMEQLWYAGGESAKAQASTLHRYSKQAGIELELQHWITKNWKFSTALDYAELRYVQADKKRSNGNQYSVSTQLQYFPNSRQNWLIGADYYRKNALWDTNAYDRYGLRLGWTQEWAMGVSTHLHLSYARRLYKAAAANAEDVFAPSFFKIAQKNHEYNGSLTLWHRGLHWQGITPKITWSYQKVRSNNPFADYDRHRVYLTFSKTF